MALGDPYCTLEELRDYASILDGADDLTLEVVAKAVSRNIEQVTGRQFNDAGAATPRAFWPYSPNAVYVDDFSTTTGLVIGLDSGDGLYSTTLAATEYRLEPLNGVVEGQTGRPYNHITTWSRAYGWGWARTSIVPPVRVTARWGWAAVPPEVVQATLMQSARMFSRKFSVNGVVGAGDFAFRVSTLRLDPDVAALVAPLSIRALVG